MYKHIRTDTNEVFYIGIGCKPQYARAKTKHGRNKFWKNIATKVQWNYQIVSEDLDKASACKLECELISKYGRRINHSGTLCNITEGGEGTVGSTHIVSKDARKRIGSAQLGKTVTSETRQKLREARIGKKLSDVTKSRIRNANSGTNHPNFGKNLSEETKKKISCKNTGKIQSDGSRRKKSETLKKIGMSLKSTQSKAVDIFKVNGDFVGRFHSISEASRQLNIPSNSNLRLAASGKRNRTQAYGYTVEYVNSGD